MAGGAYSPSPADPTGLAPVVNQIEPRGKRRRMS